MGTLIAVGEKYPLFQDGTRKMQFQDGALFEALEDDGGFILAIYLNQPHADEISIFRDETIKTKIIREGDNLVLPMVQFGSTQMIFEISFDPTLYKDGRAFQWKDKNNVLMIVLIDSSNGKVAALRPTNFPLKLIQCCNDAWAKAMIQTNYSEEYAKWYGSLRRYSLEQLWERAVYVGKMGETYDLEELNYHHDSSFYKKE